MDDYWYMCGECLQFSGSIDEFIHHVCQKNTDNTDAREKETEILKKDTTKVISVGSEPPESVITAKSIAKTAEGYISSGQDLSDYYATEDEDAIAEVGGKKRKKYQAMAEEYRVNRIMRDKDFKLGRTHFYNFKDTLGDWDERSTKLLIHLVQKYPKSHFLLPTKAERRLGHWECIHQEMETAGYTFTVLQLRMRWREVLQKYRWTGDYNDAHEIKKKCEYFDEMNGVFGDWDEEATQCLLKQMQQINMENHNKKIIRIGYVGWERITASLNNEGHRFTIDQTEARWRNMVTLFKTMVDHNALPNVEPFTVAYKEDLEKLLNYVPKRRQIYEKVKGRSVKMERFPTKGIRVLLQAYKDCIGHFMDPKIRNAIVWDKIKQKLEEEGYKYTTLKLKDILNGIIKGYEKSQHHNSLPGAIRRDVPYYRELSEIFGTHGRWPHVQSSRTIDMRNRRKFRLRLQASQQLWSNAESRALLEVYPDVLEAHVNQNVSHQASDLWLQVAKAYSATGFPKRDVPEVAVHIGLLRLGYAQNNLFPFVEEMRKVKETEEAVCYSPDVSKFIGDVEVIYWSHDAVNHLLDLYLEHQAAATSQSSRDEVFANIRSDMLKLGYRYTKEQIFDHFKTLLTQYRTRTSKLWGDSASNRKMSNPTGAPYLEKLEKVCQLRRKLSLSWTSGVTPLDDTALKIVFKVALEEAEELLKGAECIDERKIIPQLLEQIQSQIRNRKLLEVVPRARQIRLHLVSALNNFCENEEENIFIAKLHSLFRTYHLDGFYTSYKEKGIHILDDKSRKRRNHRTSKKSGKKQKLSENEISSSDEQFSDSADHSVKLKNDVSNDANFIENSSQGKAEINSEVLKQNSSCLPANYHRREDRADKPCLEEGHNSYRALVSHNMRKCDASDGSFGINEPSDDCNININYNDMTGMKSSFDSICENQMTHDMIELRKSVGICSSEEKIVVKAYCDSANKPACKSQSTVVSIEALNSSGECYRVGRLVEEKNLMFTKSQEKRNTSEEFLDSDSVTAECPNVNEGSVQRLVSGICNEANSKKSEAKTKVIQTRSGRKTRFTFFTEFLSENFEDEQKKGTKLGNKCTPDIGYTDLKQIKSIQNKLAEPIARKRGRPPKQREPEAIAHISSEINKACLSENDRCSYKTQSTITTLYVNHQESLHKTNNSEYGLNFSSLDDRISLSNGQKSSMKDTSCSTQAYKREDCLMMDNLDSSVVFLLKRHKTERQEKESKFLEILVDFQTKQNVVLSQTLEIINGLKCRLNRRFQSI